MAQPESHDDIPTSTIKLAPAQPDSDKAYDDNLTEAVEHRKYDSVTALLASLRDDIGEQNFQHWFHERTRFEVSGDRFVVYVANPFILNWLLRRFRSALNRAAQLHPVSWKWMNCCWWSQRLRSQVNPRQALKPLLQIRRTGT